MFHKRFLKTKFYSLIAAAVSIVLLTACVQQVQPGLPGEPTDLFTPEPTFEAISTIPANTASISGIVWHDICMLQGGEGSAPVQPSDGCVPGIEGGFEANGIFEPGEPVLGDVLVSLGYGSCSEVDDYYEIRTSADGSYAFANLVAGNYCIVVDSLRSENSTLLPGQWTAPAGSSNASAIRVNITVMHGEQKTGVDFGWDYQFLPLPERQPAAPEPPGSIRPSFISGTVWADYCVLLTKPDGTTMPSGGCVANGSGGYKADGVWNNGETSINGLAVTLTTGICPGDVNRAVSATTDLRGTFRFDKLNPGDYCVSIDPYSNANRTILGLGEWTSPANVTGGITITLGAGQDEPGVDFGWDHQELQK